MNQALTDEMTTMARYVVGRDARKRSRSEEPGIKNAIRDAEHFLGLVEEKMDIPSISGGTTAEPVDILTMSWRVPGVQKGILGIYVTFHGDHTCNVKWHEPDESYHALYKVPVNDLVTLNLPSKLDRLKKLLQPSKNYSF